MKARRRAPPSLQKSIRGAFPRGPHGAGFCPSHRRPLGRRHVMAAASVGYRRFTLASVTSKWS